MDATLKKSSSCQNALSIWLFKQMIFTRQIFFCLLLAPLLLGCGFTPIYNNADKNLAPDLIRSLKITGAGEAARQLERELLQQVAINKGGQYDIIITLKLESGSEIIEQTAQAARRRMLLTATMTATNSRPPHIQITRSRSRTAASNDRRDALANLSSKETLRRQLVAQISDDMLNLFLYLSNAPYKQEQK